MYKYFGLYENKSVLNWTQVCQLHCKTQLHDIVTSQLFQANVIVVGTLEPAHRLNPGSTVAGNSTESPNIEGSNPITGITVFRLGKLLICLQIIG